MKTTSTKQGSTKQGKPRKPTTGRAVRKVAKLSPLFTPAELASVTPRIRAWLVSLESLKPLAHNYHHAIQAEIDAAAGWERAGRPTKGAIIKQLCGIQDDTIRARRAVAECVLGFFRLDAMLGEVSAAVDGNGASGAPARKGRAR